MITINFSDGSEQTAATTGEAEEINLAAFGNGATVESITDNDKEYGATWSVSVDVL